MKRELEKDVREDGDHTSINWSTIEDEVATDFHARGERVTVLRFFFDGGHVLIFDWNDQGHATEGASGCPNAKLNKDLLNTIATHVDDMHIKGKFVASNGVKYHLLQNVSIDVHRTTCDRAIGKMGIIWSPIEKFPRTIAL